MKPMTAYCHTLLGRKNTLLCTYLSQKVLDLFVQFLLNALGEPGNEEAALCAQVCCVQAREKARDRKRKQR